VRTIAFPAISCGVYGYPVAEAASIAVGEVRSFLQSNPVMERVTLSCFGRTVLDAYLRAVAQPA